MLLLGLLAAHGAEGTVPDRAGRWLGDRAFPTEREADDTTTGSLATPPVPAWTVRLPGPPLNAASHTERSRPVVIGDRILVGSASGQALYALDLHNGAVVGRYPANASVEAEPLVVGDRVYFADTSGTTFCYTLDGEMVWSHRSNAPILTRPTVVDGRLYLTNVDDLGLALDAVTGEQIWRYKAKRDLLRVAELALYAAPAVLVSNGVAVFGFSSGEVVGLDAASGDARWKLAVGEGRYPDIVATPVAAGTDLFVSGYFEPLVAIDRTAHAVRWRADVGAAFPVLVHDGTVYHPGSDGVLRAFSALTGAEKWTWSSGTTTALTTPVLTDAGLFVGASAGALNLVDPATGEAIWTWREPVLLEGLNATPVVYGDKILFVTNAGNLHVMTTADAPRRQLQHRWFGRRD
ncbi:MAG: PQQ-binding-like beta-propeller repeat protein [Alphaproteobacteria bacterium]|nr:PQQ-binding-like beta-propeller repeat protein [Alphaproteobacteria bacterium]MCB9690566.1 PQQ-binding-like beta-propeller repeat protein [Alphaproteobacteria bacterium]